MTRMDVPWVTIKWRVERVGDDGYLHEEGGAFHHVRYGPMPPEFIGPLMDERREHFEDLAARVRKEMLKGVTQGRNATESE